MYTYPQFPGWPGDRPLVIAEVGLNHGGDEALAWEMIAAAHAHGADFVKLQSYRMEDFLHPAHPGYASVAAMALSPAAHERLFARAAQQGIVLFSTPFDRHSADMLDRFDPPAFKIASMDNNNAPLLEHVAAKGKPVIVSLGMAGLCEAERIQRLFGRVGNTRLVFLHCIADYPAQAEDMHLAAIPGLRRSLDAWVGLSDHSLGTAAACMAVSLGAVAVEKHFTTDRGLHDRFPDADNNISMEPAELAAISEFCRQAPRMLGVFPRPLTAGEDHGVTAYKRGVYAARDIAAGEVLAEENVRFLRPVAGIPVDLWPQVAGRTAARDIPAASPIAWADLR